MSNDSDNVNPHGPSLIRNVILMARTTSAVFVSFDQPQKRYISYSDVLATPCTAESISSALTVGIILVLFFMDVAR